MQSSSERSLVVSFLNVFVVSYYLIFYCLLVLFSGVQLPHRSRVDGTLGTGTKVRVKKRCKNSLIAWKNYYICKKI